MEENQRLSERMINGNVDYGPTDKEWNQFVRDHKTYIKGKSTLKTYTPEYLAKYRYNPEEFHMENEGLLQTTWIFMLINDMYTSVDFTEGRTQYWRFDTDVISDMYEFYRASRRVEDGDDGVSENLARTQLEGEIPYS